MEALQSLERDAVGGPGARHLTNAGVAQCWYWSASTENGAPNLAERTSWIRTYHRGNARWPVVARDHILGPNSKRHGTQAHALEPLKEPNQQDLSRSSPLIAGVAQRRAVHRDRLNSHIDSTELTGRLRKTMHGSGS